MSVLSKGNVDKEIHLVNLSRPLNENQFEKVTRTFKDIAGQGLERVVVNLAEVPLIDSRGLAALVAGYKIFGSKPEKFRLAALQNQPKLVFELTGFDNIFQIFDTVAAAAELEPFLELEISNGSLAAVPQAAVLELPV